MKQQYNKLWFIKDKQISITYPKKKNKKDKQINETTQQQYIWEKFLEPPLRKNMLLKEHIKKNS